MRTIFYLFLIYSVCGWALETVYAALRSKRLENRKTMLILPMCPVYGAGAVAITLTSGALGMGPLLTALSGAAIASAVEYFYALLCEKLLKVKLWDYANLKGSLHGRINALYSAFWGVLAVALVYAVHPHAAALAEAMPIALFWPLFLLFIVDLALTGTLLYRFGRKNSRMIGCPVARRVG